MAKRRSPWDQDALHGFQKAAESLKLYRRADLSDPDQGSPLIDALYVDPLPQEQILRTILKPNTTFVIGRKGTGKSTIFQRLQSEVRKSKTQTSAYIDIKTIFESSQVDPGVSAKVAALPNALPASEVERLLLHREFLRAIIIEIKSELKKRASASLLERIKERFTGTLADLFEGLESVLEEANEHRFVSILGLRTNALHDKSSTSNTSTISDKASLALSKSPEFKAELNDSNSASATFERTLDYNDILLRTFNIKNLIVRLKDLLDALGIRHLFVLVDDFSELPEDAMRVVVDVLLAPLNNWSDEFVKFKVAAYPGRTYFGAIDKTKIDEIYLDLYSLYGGGDVGRMEDSAIDFTRRLVVGRISHFCKMNADLFLESQADDELWRQLFYASMANPRTLGHLLHFLYESHLIRQRKIGIRAIQEAAERYYLEKIEPYFRIGKFLHESFEERSSIFSLKELLEAVVERARALRSHESKVIELIREKYGTGRHPTSHFHVPVEYESLFATLELNFFLTKYFEMSDRSGHKVAVFALNYGLCSKQDIAFGRPVGEREFRLYFVERFFDYSVVVLAYLAKNQEIVCDRCGKRYSHDQLEAIKLFGMLCPGCRAGGVRVTNLSRKYAAELEAVSEESLLPATELGILQTLFTERGGLRAGAIAGELDCSYQLIGRRGKALYERGLVDRYENEQGHRLFEITPAAEAAYFADAGEAVLEGEG